MSTTLETRKRRHLLADPTDVASRREVHWHETAPSALRRAAGRKRPKQLWSAWTAALAGRRSQLPRLFRASASPLLWGLDSQSDGQNSQELIDILWRAGRGKRRALAWGAKHLPNWLSDVEAAPGSVEYALHCLAWCHALPRLAEHVAADAWWQMFWHLADAAAEAQHAAHHGDSLAAALLGAELPNTLAALFPEIEECHQLQQTAAGWMTLQLIDPTVEETLLATRRRDWLRPTLACWTRTRALSSGQGKEWFRGKPAKRMDGNKHAGKLARRQFRRLLLAAMRLTAGGERALLMPARPPGRDLDALFRTAVQLDGGKSVARAWRMFCKAKPPVGFRGNGRPFAATAYEAASLAILRSDWSRGATALGADFGSQALQLELNVAGSALLRGVWDFEILADGQAVSVPSLPWDLVCWETNKRSQWLELELDLGKGLRIERGMLLAPEDEFALLIDVVAGPPGGALQYTGRLPLAHEIRAKEAGETREVSLQGGKIGARVLPLALCEWRSDPRFGQLRVESNALQLRQQTRGGSICAPLFLDFSRQRRQAPLTWRQLTVGEDRRPVEREVAAGYRVQVGVQQWLVYRAVRTLGNRTVLGQNLATEFKVGRFLANGDVQTIVEIE